MNCAEFRFIFALNNSFYLLCVSADVEYVMRIPLYFRNEMSSYDMSLSGFCILSKTKTFTSRAFSIKR